jgi:predicted phosphodiesterase
MRLHVMSDLHLELFPAAMIPALIKGFRRDADYLVLAGDIFSLAPQNANRTETILACFHALGYKKILYVPGNHEFWDTNFEDGWKRLRELEKQFPTLTALRSGTVLELEGRRIHGDTMWFPFNPSNFMYERHMPDFKRIDDVGRIAYQQNSVFREHVRKHVKPGDIVITHHLPSHKSIPEHFQNSQTNRFFVSDMTRFMVELKPRLWIHGHTHGCFDYMVADTRIICNPRGYPGQMSFMVWDKSLIIEV